MKNCFCKIGLFVVVSIFSWSVYAQSDSLKIDSLKKVLLTEKEDTNKVHTLNELSYELRMVNEDYENSILYAKEALSLSEKIFFKKGSGEAYRSMGAAFDRLYNSPEALKNCFAALKIYKELGDKLNMAESFQSIGYIYQYEGNMEEGLNNCYASLKIREELGDKKGMGQTYNTIGIIYASQGKFDQALEKQFLALQIFKAPGMPAWGLPLTYGVIADSYSMQGDMLATVKGNKKEAKSKYLESFKNTLLARDGYQKMPGGKSSVAGCDITLANLSLKLDELLNAKQYVQKGLQLSKELKDVGALSGSYFVLYTLDSTEGNYKQAFEDYKLYKQYSDSINNDENSKKFVQIQMQHEFEGKEAIAKAAQDKKDADAKRIKNQQYFAIGALGIVVLAVLIIALIQFRNNKQKQKANNLITRQKQQVETTLTELKSTQAQLIQSEKMASLGELTAGIAHEIQNPLNFVNNFSEVNKELVDELQTELKAGNTEEALAISNDIKENEEKINHHGKRADSIVKGMLQHSKKTSGQKEPTDINALADEYLKLSYHGLRAKDKEFNATLNTNFDETIGNINIIPQDISRVLLNLYNNAFYAVNEKKVSGIGYEPTVSVSTRKIGNSVTISVSDNGNGIPQNIVDKIFQPFFTTKPTGQGTGLGLSLSYDIVKAHGGELKVETKDGEGSKFIVQLPLC